MPKIEIEPRVTLHYQDHCFADPWSKPEAIVLIHGNGESSDGYYAWVPALTSRFRLIRPDLRGFGKSTIPPPGYNWSPSAHAADLNKMLGLIGVEKAHIVGAKYGGSVAAQFAVDYPGRVLTLSLIGPMVKGKNTGSKVDTAGLRSSLDVGGHAAHAVDLQRQRMGTDATPAQIEWWNKHMLEGDQVAAEELLRMAGSIDLTPILPRIAAPTLVLTADQSATQRLEWVIEWQRTMQDSELAVLACDGYHIAGVRAQECAQQIASFIERRAARKAAQQ